MVDLPELLRGQDAERYAHWRDLSLEAGLPEVLASQRSVLFESFGLLDVVRLARQSGQDPRHVADVYFRLYERFDAEGLLNQITDLPRGGRWKALARAALRDDLYALLVSVTKAVLDDGGERDPADGAELVAAWESENSVRLERAQGFLDEMRESDAEDLAALSVALRQLRSVTAQ